MVAAAGASEETVLRRDTSEDKPRPSKFQPPSAGGDHAPGPILAEHWPEPPEGWRSLGSVLDDVLVDTARRAIAYQLDSAARGAPDAVAQADGIRQRMGWTWPQVVGAGSDEVAA